MSREKFFTNIDKTDKSDFYYELILMEELHLNLVALCRELV